MKRILSSLIVAAGLVALAPLAVHAIDRIGPSIGPRSVPELDPSALSAALALLAGGAAVIAGRRRRG
jgi:hypothetical protein